MYKFLLLLGLLCPVRCEKARETEYVHPLQIFDRFVGQIFALFPPLGQLVREGLIEKISEEPQIVSDPNRFEVNLNVKGYKPDELRIKVKNRNIIVEGKSNEKNNHEWFTQNYFVQHFTLPAGSKPEEVSAVLNENGVLSISAPKHKLPPPPPEREVPIVVRRPVEKPDKEESDSNKDNLVEKLEPTTANETLTQASSASPVEIDLVEAKTNVEKTWKKKMKTKKRTSKDNKATKEGDGNLDYELMEAEK